MTITINGSGTITGVSAGGLPDGTIQQADLAANVAGTGPVFSAYASGSTACANSTWTKLQINTKEFDTNNNYDTSSYRFTPTVAGYYQVSGAVSWPSPVNQNGFGIYKNGSIFKYGYYMGNAGNTYVNIVSALIYFNGSTDYAELYTIQSTGSSQNASGASNGTYFQAALVRGA